MNKIQLLHSIERFAIISGVLGILVTGLVSADALLSARDTIASFEQTVWAPAQMADPDPDKLHRPVALLAIASLNLEVPVFMGTHRKTLHRGAGIVDGSDLPGQGGNVAIAAHRDSFFRPLKDIGVGDLIVLRSAHGTEQFQVESVFITDPLDISVLAPTNGAVLTLITCYPFNYVGFAPDRYVVRAVRV